MKKVKIGDISTFPFDDAVWLVIARKDSKHVFEFYLNDGHDIKVTVSTDKIDEGLVIVDG